MEKSQNNTALPEEKEQQIKVNAPKRNLFKKIFTRRNVIIGSISFCFIGLITLALILGYLYMGARSNIKDLKDDKVALENEKASLESDNSSLEADLQAAQDAGTVTDEEKQELQDQIDNLKAKSTQIDLYNDVFDYAVDLLIAHPTLTGFTDAEYQAGRALAVKTGDQGLISATDNAWNNTDGNPVARFAQVLQEIVQGIDANT